MSKITIRDDSDPNYLATTIIMPEIKPHPNADRLSVVTVFGNEVVIGKGMYEEGEKVVYFPVESKLDLEFLSWANLLEIPEMNADKTVKGFFNTKGRVRAINLRGIPSQGFLFKVSKLAEYFNVKETLFQNGESFNEVNGVLLVDKYIMGDKSPNSSSKKRNKKVPFLVDKVISVFPRSIRKPCYTAANRFFSKDKETLTSYMIPDQFKFHYKTEQLGKNIFKVNPDDDIVVTSKLHGTSAIYAHVICQNKLNLWDFISLCFHRPVKTADYKHVYASRSKIKARLDQTYTDDVWGVIAEEMDYDVPRDHIVYGEIVGYTPTNRLIQKNYDYGLTEGNCEFRVYRIVKNTEDGPVELSWEEIEDMCHDYQWNHVPVYYKGKAKDLFPEIETDESWSSKFLDKLKEIYLDKPDEFCKNDVINEGIVVRNETRPDKLAFKFKSPMFLLKETEERDNGESNMEDDS